MTCIIGVEHDGVVYMGADSIGLNGWGKDVIAQQKIFVRGNLIFACAGSPRMAQIIRYLTPINFLRQSAGDDEEYLVTHVIETIRMSLREHGYTSTENGQEQGASFLMGYNGKVYEVQNAYQLCRSSRKMCAMGVGDSYALGALYSTLNQFETWTETAITEAMKHAMATAETLCSGVAGPFFVEKLDTKQLPEDLSIPGLVALSRLGGSVYLAGEQNS